MGGRNARPRVIRGTRTAPLPLLPSGPGGVCGRPLHGARDLTRTHANTGRGSGSLLGASGFGLGRAAVMSVCVKSSPLVEQRFSGLRRHVAAANLKVRSYPPLELVKYQQCALELPEVGRSLRSA